MSRKELPIITFDYDGTEVSICGAKNDYIFDHIFSKKSFYEEDLLRLLSSIPIKDGAFVDVGANIGNHSIFFSLIMQRRTYSFEISEHIRNILKQNVTVNNQKANIDILDFGLYSRSAQVLISQNDENLGMTRIISVDGDQPEQVPVHALDDVFPKDQELALIKVDVEGVELDVLKGANATIARC